MYNGDTKVSKLFLNFPFLNFLSKLPQKSEQCSQKRFTSDFKKGFRLIQKPACVKIDKTVQFVCCNSYCNFPIYDFIFYFLYFY